MKPRQRELQARLRLYRMLNEVESRHRQAVEQEKKIAVAAAHRLAAVNQELDPLKEKTLTDDAASERYQRLIMERGRLQQTLSQAQQTLRPEH